MMKYNNKIDIEDFVEEVQEEIKSNVKKVIINGIEIAIGEDLGLSLCADDRVPKKNIMEIREREKMALSYEQQGIMDMAAIELEECAIELLWNCPNATLNISTKNIETICSYLEHSRKCWERFSGAYILPSQSKSY